LGLLLIEGAIGTIYLAVPFFISHLFLFFIRKKVKISNNIVLIFPILAIFTLSGIINITTTILFSSIISSLFVLYYYKFDLIPRKVPPIFVALTFVLVAYAIYDFDPKKNLNSLSDSVDGDLNVFSFQSVLERASFKFTEDRAPLWQAVYNNYVIDGGLWPAILKEQLLMDISYYDSLNADSDLAAHNLYLELIRNYGLIAGVVISIIFIFMIFLGSKPLYYKNGIFPSILLSALVLSIGYYGSMAGQFPLTGFFSFIFLGIAGANYKLYKERND
jgi:O-antigen ligase